MSIGGVCHSGPGRRKMRYFTPGKKLAGVDCMQNADDTVLVDFMFTSKKKAVYPFHPIVCSVFHLSSKFVNRLGNR